MKPSLLNASSNRFYCLAWISFVDSIKKFYLFYKFKFKFYPKSITLSLIYSHFIFRPFPQRFSRHCCHYYFWAGQRNWTWRSDCCLRKASKEEFSSGSTRSLVICHLRGIKWCISSLCGLRWPCLFGAGCRHKGVFCFHYV